MTKLILSSSLKRAFKITIKSRPDLKSKIEAKLRLLAEDLIIFSISMLQVLKNVITRVNEAFFADQNSRFILLFS
ncbi:MAG: hypothetical protein RLZZ143_183 [Cyanobacteriota bacterium]|jgi:hypothetical protein